MPTRIDPPAKPIALDLTAALSFEHGLGRAELLQLGPQLEDARRRLLAGEPTVLTQAQQLLDGYEVDRHCSTLGQILPAAKQMRDLVDRAVILAPPQLIDAAKALFAACCHPHHNDLSRGQRGGRPRIFFADAAAENDTLQGLLDVLPHGRQLQMVDERWGIVAIDDAKNCNLLAGLFGLLWESLQTTADSKTESQFAVAVGHANSPLMEFAAQIECQRIELVSSACEVFHPGVLTAASVMGMDIVKLLRGAALMSERFETAPPGDNPALDLAGVRHLLAQRRGIEASLIESYDTTLQLLAEFVSPQIHSARHLLIQLIPQALRRDRLRVTMRAPEAAAAEKKRITRYLPELGAARVEGTREVRTAAGEPTAVVQLPVIDESSIGQLAQLFAIANSVQQELKTL